MEISVLLHNIRSAHNVGSIFRTCDAAGVSRVYLTGYTPTPTDRFGRAQKDIAKTALGAERAVSWEYHKNPLAVIAKLHDEGRRIVAVEQNPHSIDYRKFQSKKPAVFIFGNEVRGISKSILNACDSIIEIPMHGKKESLNVSVAAGIVLFQAVDSH
ncbi:MAG TPA: RNA methyltransferase [Candidatus Paceibacterota bacterium]